MISDQSFEIPDGVYETTMKTWRRMCRTARTPLVRTIRQFAEDEIWIPEGKFENQRWQPWFQPYSALLFELMDCKEYNQFIITGCVQSGKSFSSFVVPAIYHLCEMRESVILGAPTMDIARDKWRQEIEPVIRRTRYASLLPDAGGGSRGGFVEAIELRNGATLKFMSGHGGDEKRSSFTSRVVIVTEADKMDEAGEVSREASPIRQMLARMESYDLTERRAYIECTVSTEIGYIWREYNAGTASQLLSQCPHCSKWICPERDNFRFLAECETAADAEIHGTFVCPQCDTPITEQQRQEALLGMRVVHRGQRIDDSGQLVGDPPRTRQCGFRWSAWNNAFWSTAKISHDRWKAENDRDSDDADKYQKQFVWAIPYIPPDIEVSRLSEDHITRKRDFIRKGLVPSWCDWLTVGVDVGHRYIHWVAIAWREKMGSAGPDEVSSGIVDYGAFVVDSADDGPVELAIESALLKLCRGRLASDGFAIHGSEGTRFPDLVLIDSGNWEGPVRAVARSLDRQRYFSIKGRGSGQHMIRKYTQPTRTGNTVIKIGPGFHVNWLPKTAQHEFTADVDHWKSWFHARMKVDSGPGSMVLYQAERSQHRTFFKHIAAEEESVVFNKTLNCTVSKWERVHRSNHYLDASAYACVAGAYLGVTLLDTETTETQQKNQTMAKLVDSLKNQTSMGDIIQRRMRR